MTKKSLSLSSTSSLLLLFSSIAFAAPSDFNIYFINGMDNSFEEANKSRRKLRDLVLSDVPSGNVFTLYQNNDKALSEMIETVRQQASADNQRQVYKSFWKCVNNPSPETCDPTNPPTASLRQIIDQTLARYDQAAYVQNTQLQAMVSVLRDNYYNNRKKSLLVAHSQGNFYANQAVNYLQSFDPAVGACVEVVGVATPATYVAKSGPYETRADDLVINAARVNFPWGASILPPTWNPPEGIYLEPSGHKFVSSYLGPSALRQRIRDNIVLQTATVADSQCVLPRVCKTLRTSGGQGHYGFTHFLGSGTRTVNMRLDISDSSSGPDLMAVSMHAVQDDSTGAGRILPDDYYYIYGPLLRFPFLFDSAQYNDAQSIHLEFSTVPQASPVSWSLCIDCGDGACR